MRALWLGVRSIAWAVLLPGIFAFYIPWRFFGLSHFHSSPRDPAHYIGALLLISGAALLVACIWEFARSGRGTLSPADPPKELVVQGLYRYVRNPMYLSVSTIVFGELLITRSAALLVYWVLWFMAVNLFVIGYEEPTLTRQFGESYERYKRDVFGGAPEKNETLRPRRNPEGKTHHRLWDFA
jgi:protein-S-isoprenylcysteine O-methyltransferase Ste14